MLCRARLAEENRGERAADASATRRWASRKAGDAITRLVAVRDGNLLAQPRGLEWAYSLARSTSDSHAGIAVAAALTSTASVHSPEGERHRGLAVASPRRTARTVAAAPARPIHDSSSAATARELPPSPLPRRAAARRRPCARRDGLSSTAARASGGEQHRAVRRQREGRSVAAAQVADHEALRAPRQAARVVARHRVGVGETGRR